MEFQKQDRGFRQAELGIKVAGPDLQGIEQFDPRHRQAGLDGGNHRITGGTNRRKRANARRNRLGNAIEPERRLGDNAQRALRADKQPCQVIARRTLFGAGGGFDDFAIRGHHAQRDHILLHRAITHRIGAGRAGRDHAAERGVGTRINREEQALVAQVQVELLARHARLHHAVKILGMHRDNCIHHRSIDANPAIGRVDMAFQRGAGAKRDDRHAMAGA